MAWGSGLHWYLLVMALADADLDHHGLRGGLQYGRHLRSQPQLRNVVLCFLLASFLAAGIAAFLGATLNKNAPVTGGRVIQIVAEGK